MIRRFLLVTGSAIAFAVATAGPAAADPASAIIAVAGITNTVALAAVRIGVAIAMSYISQALMTQRMKQSSPGLRTETTTEGGTLPQTRILGTYATAGNVVAPFYSFGEGGGVENAYRRCIIDLADRRIDSLTAVWVDGQKFTPGGNLDGGSITAASGWGAYPTTAVGSNDDWVQTSDGTEYPYFYLKFYDGTQTDADASMLSKLGSHPERPWQSDMVGRGIAYAMTTTRYNPELFQGEPSYLFEVKGEALYDRRADTTDGGSGAQRPSSASTWTWSDNPIVMVENLLRGLPLDEGGRWGLGVDSEDLPRSAWVEAANYCDVAMSYGKRFRAGYEVRMGGADAGGEMPLDVVDELLKACTGAVADCGGTWLVRAGAPGVAVALITDDDIIIDEPQEFSVHEGITQVFNAARASHPHINRMWQASEAPIHINTAALAEDGDRLLVADLNLPAVPYRPQVKALQRAYVRDSRRFRRHTITLGPAFSNIMPLDSFNWTSARNGYVTKKFEVFEAAHDPISLCVTLSIRERDGADYDWSTDDLTDDPGPSAGVNRPQYSPLPGFDAQAAAIEDAAGTDKAPAVRLIWSKTVESGLVEWQGRRVGTTEVKISGNTRQVADGQVYITSGLRPGVSYEFRARGRNPRTGWTAWDPVTAHDLGVAIGDIKGGVIAYDRSHYKFRQGPRSQNLNTAGWRAVEGSYTFIGSARVRRTAGAVTKIRLSGKVAAWGDDAAVEVKVMRKKADGTFVFIGKAYGRTDPDGSWNSFSDDFLDENKGGNQVGQTGLQTTYRIEARMKRNRNNAKAVRVNNLTVDLVNYRRQ